MNKPLRVLVMWSALVLAACGGGDGGGETIQQSAKAGYGTEFVLGYGETVDVGNLSITFTAVTEDSRCPLNANCVAMWEGNARVQLAVTNGRASDLIDVNTNPQYTPFGVFDGRMIRLVRLDPLPWAPPRSPDSYEATLVVYENVIYTGT